MLYIRKKSAPRKMLTVVSEIKRSEAWKGLAEGDTKALRSLFDTLPKEIIRVSLLEEQKGLCAYCMRKIKNNSNTTIEHWSPLSKDKNKALDYRNFLAVCDGGRNTYTDGKAVLCCDAKKGDDDSLTINPLNQTHMQKIAYKSDGTIYTMPFDTILEEDINNKLLLNGLRDAQGNRISDTSTEIVKGRRDAYENCRNFMRMLNSKKKCTSANVQKKIEEIENAEEMQEYAGVWLYYLKKKCESLEKQNL